MQLLNISTSPATNLMINSIYAIPAARFFPLILFHSNPNEDKNEHPPAAIAMINTFRTALLYAASTSGNCAAVTIVRIPVAPALMMVLGSMSGIRADISLTRPFDNTEFEIARKIAPLHINVSFCPVLGAGVR
jgi:hypothetical protein